MWLTKASDLLPVFLDRSDLGKVRRGAYNLCPARFRCYHNLALAGSKMRAGGVS